MSIGIHWLGDPHGFYELDEERQLTLRAYHKALVEMDAGEAEMLAAPLSQNTFLKANIQMIRARNRGR